jgi:hypothetical protein
MALLAQVAHLPPARRLPALRAAWQEGCAGLGDALLDATAAAREAERERARVAEARASWVDAWPALLDLAERAEHERRAA